MNGKGPTVLNTASHMAGSGVSSPGNKPLPNDDILRSGFFTVEKFGTNNDVDTGSDPEDVWEGPDLKAGSELYTFSSGNNIDIISSDNVGDTQDVEIEGCYESGGLWIRHVQTATLNGQNTVNLSRPLIRVWRARVRDSVTPSGNIYIYEDDSVTGGVPDTASKLRAVIVQGFNQTNMAVYSTWDQFDSKLYNHYLMGYKANIGRATTSGTKEADLSIRRRLDGEVFTLIDRETINNLGSGWIKEVYEFYLPVPSKTDILWRCDVVASNNTQINAGFSILHNPQT